MCLCGVCVCSGSCSADAPHAHMRVSEPLSPVSGLLNSFFTVHAMLNYACAHPVLHPPCRAPTTSSASSRSAPRATRSWTPPWLTSSTPAACTPASAGGLGVGGCCVCVGGGHTAAQAGGAAAAARHIVYCSRARTACAVLSPCPPHASPVCASDCAPAPDFVVCAAAALVNSCRTNSRPGQCGRCDGYILEGRELEFYVRKMQKKKKGTAAA